jgi:hypothetical protein
VRLGDLTPGGAGVVDRDRTVLEELGVGLEIVRAELIHRTADLGVRAILSYTLTPSDDDPEDVAREIARILTSALETPEEDVR